jgi:hypothetical protein
MWQPWRWLNADIAVRLVDVIVCRHVDWRIRFQAGAGRSD